MSQNRSGQPAEPDGARGLMDHQKGKKQRMEKREKTVRAERMQSRLRRRKHHPAAILLLLLAGVFLLCGCEEATEFFQYQPDSAVKVEVVHKGLLSIDRITTLNPVTAKDRDVYYLNKLLYRSLFRLDETLRAREDLVDTFSLDEGARTLTVTLKQDARWADGAAIRPEDVKFTIETYKRAAASGLTLYQTQVAPISQVKVQGDSVQIRYAADSDFFLEQLTFPILSQESYRDQSQALQSTLSFLPMTSGPYRIVSFNPYSQLILAGNPQYSGQVPQNELVFKIIPREHENLNLLDPSLLTVAFSESLTREVDYSNLKASMADYVSNEVEWLGFNVAAAPFDNAELRRAVALAIDTKELLDYCYHGSGVLTDSLYYPGYWGIPNTGDLFPMDREKAVEILKQLGYQDADGDGILQDGEGKPLAFELLVNQGNVSRGLAAEQIAEDLRRAGISVAIRMEPQEAYLRALQARDYDACLGGARMGEHYDLRPLLASSGNPAGYADAEADEALRVMGAMKDSAAKEAAVKQLREKLRTDLPYYPVVYKTYGVLTSRDFQGIVHPLFFDIYREASTWKYQRTLPAEEPAPETEGEAVQEEEG